MRPFPKLTCAVHLSFLLATATFSNVLQAQWTPTGQTITGINNGGHGRNVSISADGKTLAVGGSNNCSGFGCVNVYQYNGTSWNPLGSTIMGIGNEHFGWSVSLSPDGRRLAVGVPLGRESIGLQTPTGVARIYEYTSSGWSQMGQNIDGEVYNDRFGHSISLGRNGRVVAIGADRNDENGTNAGHVRVYQYNGSAWVQLGLDIDGTLGDYSGSSIALCSDSMIVAIGAIGANNSAGKVSVYKYRNGSWIQLGNDILGLSVFSRLGRSVSLSQDGNILAVGAPSLQGSVRVFKLDGNSWNQLGSEIVGENFGDDFGESVSLNSDGTLLAVGAPFYNHTNPIWNGLTKILRYTNSEWQQIGCSIIGLANNLHSGSAVSLSLDSLVVATGTRTYSIADNVQVFSFQGEIDSMNSSSSVFITTCGSYTVPSGHETHTRLGTQIVHDTIPNAQCGDSILTIDLTLLPPKTGTYIDILCYRETVIINGTSYGNTSSVNGAIETFTNIGPFGCDSTVIINLEVLPPKIGNLSQTLCNGDSLIINGTVYNSSGVAAETFYNVGPYGCDSTVYLLLNVLPAKSDTIDLTICDGDSLVINGTSYKSSISGAKETFTNVGPYGCDSTVTINLTVLPPKTGSISQTICDGDSIVVNGNTYQASVNGATEIFTNIGPYGCDSIVTINLIVLPAKMTSINQTICDGDSIVVNGNTYKSSVTGVTEVFTNVGPYGCDSTVIINLIVLPPKTGTISQTICNGDSLIINGTSYSSSVTTTEIFTNIGPYGCDSMVTIDLKVQDLNLFVEQIGDTALLSGQFGASYQWLKNCDTNATSKPENIGQVIRVREAGHYAVIVTVNNCIDTSECTYLEPNIIRNDEKCILYPNPTNGDVTVFYNEKFIDSEIWVLDIAGQVVYTTNSLGDKSTELKLEYLSDGVYYIMLIDNKNRLKTCKLIKL